MKKIIIIKSSGGELANQLWNYASILAYTKETGAELQNWSFFEYARYFKNLKHPWFVEHIFFNRFRNDITRKSALKKRVWRKIYDIFSRIVIYFNQKSLIQVKDHEEVFVLPPTSNKHLDELSKSDTIYLDGWIFRNSDGIAKHRDYISSYFAPQDSIASEVENFISPLRAKYKHVIGVHIRQGDYKTWRGGAYYISPKEMSDIVKLYLEKANLDTKDTCLVIASDGNVPLDLFAYTNAVPTNMSMVYDLFALSKCDVVIGSDSTFGDFACYLGNIPHIIAKKEPVDWEYYQGKNYFFENKYCSWVHY